MMEKILHLGATPSVVCAAGAGAVAVLLALPLADRLPMPVVLWSLILGRCFFTRPSWIFDTVAFPIRLAGLLLSQGVVS